MGDAPTMVHRFAPADSRLTALARANATERAEQKQHLESVSKRIAGVIVAFCRERVGRQFYADQLREHVELRCGRVAPGSADRVLRDLRQREVIQYSVVSRKDSLYQVESVKGEK